MATVFDSAAETALDQAKAPNAFDRAIVACVENPWTIAIGYTAFSMAARLGETALTAPVNTRSLAEAAFIGGSTGIMALISAAALFAAGPMSQILTARHDEIVPYSLGQRAVSQFRRGCLLAAAPLLALSPVADQTTIRCADAALQSAVQTFTP